MNADPRWPVALVTGFLGSGKTTLVRALLTRDGMSDTLVVVNEFGAIGIDHDLIAAVHDDVVLLRGGCLCCGVRQDLARTLRDLHLRAIQRSLPPFARVVVETTGLADPGSVVATLAAHPLVNDAYALRSVTTLVDAEHGAMQLTARDVARRQVAAADRLLVSKTDRVSAETVVALFRQLRAVNPIAALGRSRFGDADPAPLFASSATRMLARRVWPDREDGHLDGVKTYVLRSDQPLSWPAVQRWLADLMAQVGDRLLRLKGLLDLVGQERPIVVQAVHHSFYPLESLLAWPRGEATSTLVLITSGEIEAELLDRFMDCR